jgi:hypothetical protein
MFIRFLTMRVCLPVVRACAPVPLLRCVALAVIGSWIPLLASDYLTEGKDPGRTGWMTDEKVFTPANVKDIKLLWKLKLDSQPREMHNVFSPLIAERVTTARGPREIAIVAGISDDLLVLGPASLGFAEHPRAVDAHRCEWCRVRSIGTVERAGRTLCTAWCNRQDALAERQDDHRSAVGPEFLGRIRSRIHGHARRHGLRVRLRDGAKVEAEGRRRAPF